MSTDGAFVVVVSAKEVEIGKVVVVATVVEVGTGLFPVQQGHSEMQLS